MNGQYEISLWSNKLVASKVPDQDARYKERKIAIIGSDSMPSNFKVFEPILQKNINGTNKFSFKLKYSFIDSETGKKVKNPFLPLLVNERKVKVRWGTEWYDFVIKNIIEDSAKKIFTYECQDIFINELSKNGFNLEFSNALQNNSHTITDFGRKVLEGTDWQVRESDIIRQTNEEALYKVTLDINQDFQATQISKNGKVLPVFQDVTIGQQSTLYFFRSDIENKSVKLQFINNSTYETNKPNPLILNANNFFVNADVKKVGDIYKVSIQGKTELISLEINSNNITFEYRGKKFIEYQQTAYDPKLKRYVNIYDKVDVNPPQKIYGYEALHFNNPVSVTNILTNSENFSNIEGWVYQDLNDTPVQLLMLPKITPETDLATYKGTSYLGIDSNNTLLKIGSYFDKNITKEQPFIFRLNGTNIPNDLNVSLRWGHYDEKTNTYWLSEETIINFDEKNSNTNWNIEKSGKALNSYTKEELMEGKECVYKILEPSGKWVSKMFFSQPALVINSINPDLIYEIKAAQLYPAIIGSEGTYIEPNQLDIEVVSEKRYKYYDPNDKNNQKAGKEEDYVFLYNDTTPWEKKDKNIIPRINSNFEKIRSIEIKNSNRFNILQTLAETFECWVKFIIEHNPETGEILYDENNQPKKYIEFKENIGRDTNLGFVYGIDLKGVTRKINSSQITTKVIVSPNVTDSISDGFCSIAKSKLNNSRENFILNFDYYVNHNLIDQGVLAADLFKYYEELRSTNDSYDKISGELKKNNLSLINQESKLTVYDHYITSANSEIDKIRQDIVQLTQISNWGSIEDPVPQELKQYLNENPENVKVLILYNTYNNQNNIKKNYIEQKNTFEQSLKDLRHTITFQQEYLKILLAKLQSIHDKFYKKYAEYIQEGSWTSDKYFDDDLYYLDACAVAHTSAFPQVSYNISVIRLTQLEEFKIKNFQVGDIGFVEDPEFFGYRIILGKKTPYREKVVISGITINFDSPEKDNIIVQNYRTQFEDLFQRIAATSQTLKLASGDYQKAANGFESDGSIKLNSIQNTIDSNNTLVVKYDNNHFYQDATGLKVTDNNDPNIITKITAGGIFISTDGGVHWSHAINGRGINTSNLSAGLINVNEINLIDGNHGAFRWDSSGINAYRQGRDDNNNLSALDTNTFVRFDHYGIYGIQNYEGETSFIPEDENDIWNAASFGLTWQGFFLKNNYDNGGRVIISSKDDIIVQRPDNNNELINIIKIGKFNTQTNTSGYGIQIRDLQNEIVMESNERGDLKLQGQLHIRTSGKNEVKIGYLPPEKETNPLFLDSKGDPLSQVFNANGNFIIYENGTIKAESGQFNGVINASQGGMIGGIKVTSTGLMLDNDFTKIILDLRDGFSIFKKESNQLSNIFNIDKETGDINIRGIINATGSVIGGFRVFGNSLQSTENANNPDSNSNPKLELNGLTGSITAKSITLGEETQINSHILFNSPNINTKPSYIFNPTTRSDGLFMRICGDASDTSGKIDIYSDGIIKVGNIEINGVENSIKAITKQEANSFGWSIDGNGRATFNNIAINNADISSVVFEKNSVQTVGSTMIFSDSTYGIIDLGSEEQIQATIKIEDVDFSIDIKDIIIVSGKDNKDNNINETYIVEAIDKKESSFSLKITKGKKDFRNLSKVNITRLGKDGEKIFSISSNTENPPFISNPNTLTLARLSQNNNEIKAISKVIIGDLSNIPGEFVTAFSLENSYGLYSDNVILSGSLITKITGEGQAPAFAGVNTLQRKEKDNVVFWAGAKDIKNIESACFRVYDNGNLYASNGYFSGEIAASKISGGEIRKTDIFDSSIIGQSDNINLFLNNEKAININKGMPKKYINEKGEEKVELDTFLKIELAGIFNNQEAFIQFNNDKKVDFIGNSISLEKTAENKCQIQSDSLTFSNKANNFKVLANNDILSLSLNNLDAIMVDPNNINLNSNNLRIARHIEYSDIMKLQKIEAIKEQGTEPESKGSTDVPKHIPGQGYALYVY